VKFGGDECDFELLHSSFDNLNGYMVRGYHPHNSNRAKHVFVVKRRSGTALNNGNRVWYLSIQKYQCYFNV